MPETSAKQAEIAIEQRYVDRVYARLSDVRAETEALRDRGYRLAHGADREAIFEQAQMLLERDVLVRHATRLLQTLDAEHEGLVFGRLDVSTNDGETLYIGRVGLRDENFDNLVLDWRAPAAGAFYQATAEYPMGVLRRRVIRCSRQRVVDVDDDVLAPGVLPPDIRVVGEGALLAAMGRARGDRMRDIVATIQREQDAAIRAPSLGVTEITGGPGTGKTAVALHRVAYQIYRDRRRMTGAGVLVIGPSPVFTEYISRVLPSMGEDSVELRALGEVLDGARASRVDTARVAAIKGSRRMLTVLRRAVRQTPPGVPGELRIVYRGEVLTLGTAELEQVRQAVHRRGGPANRCRVDAAEALLEALWRRADSYAADDRTTRTTGRRFVADHDEFITELGERLDFHRFLVTWWPELTPAGVLSWLADRDRLAAAAGRTLTAAEIDLLARSWSTTEPGTSVADIALLDELRVLLGQPRRRRSAGPVTQLGPARDYGVPRRRAHYDEYAHVVVDEAQDLSPMQWRMVGRRGRHAHWTIVGDPLQSSWHNPAEAHAAKEAALRSVRTRRRFVLRTNYRNSAEIFALAARVLGPLTESDPLPNAVRHTGTRPSTRTVEPARIASAVRAATCELLDATEGTVGVITAMDQRDEVSSWLTAVVRDRLRVIGSLDAKGLEYDGVLVVAPEEIIAESPTEATGRRTLYVALTRATQRLIVIATNDSWLG